MLPETTAITAVVLFKFVCLLRNDGNTKEMKIIPLEELNTTRH
jgi:hypothetical protein